MKSVIRLGKKENNNNGPRLVKVILDSEDTAKEVFKAAPKLANATENYMKEIKIFRDMCKADRDKRKKLVDEMSIRNNELRSQNVTNFKWIIRGENLVRIRINPNQTKTSVRPSPKNGNAQISLNQ